jgi:hypothetical protein
VDVLESHSGAETMPGRCQCPVYSLLFSARLVCAFRRTVLGEDVQALLHAQGRVEDDQTVADGQHVIAGPGLEEGADGALLQSASVHGAALQHLLYVPGRPAARGRAR